MLFRPNFCSSCGEKVERAHWGVLTSRRFCQVCESQYKRQDLIPRVIVVGGVVVGVIGLGAYLKSGPAEGPLTVRQPLSTVERAAAKTADPPENESTGPVDPKPRQLAAVTQGQGEQPVRVTSEEQYFCGAETKKGTPCSRRVKGNVRCYQHTGMPAMATAAKLRIK